MPYFTTFDNPCIDLGGESNMPPPPLWKRPIIAALKCSLKGHNYRIFGYSNAHKFNWTQWQIGAHMGCERCGQRRFELESQAQFDEVLRMERERWEAFFAKKNAKRDALASEEMR
jgi:hypothetical protein